VLIQKIATAPFTKNDITSMVASLRMRNVHPFEEGKFCGTIAPAAWGDALNDVTNNSLTDILKRNVEGVDLLRELPGGEGDDYVEVMDWAGCRFYETTIVTATPNYKGNSGVTAYRTTIYGKQGLIGISLGAKENTSINDGNWRNLEVWTRRYDGPSISDPASMIGGSAAYNFNIAFGVVPDGVGRVRMVDAPTNIT
jgi:hypothetical protein